MPFRILYWMSSLKKHALLFTFWEMLILLPQMVHAYNIFNVISQIRGYCSLKKTGNQRFICI